MPNTVIRDYVIPAGEQLPIMIPGRFLMVLEAASALDITVIRKNSPVGEAEGVEASFTYGPLRPGEEFQGIKVSSSDGSAQTVKIGISDDEIGYQVMAGSINAIITSASGIDSQADVSITAESTVQLVAANTDRREIIIANLSTNTQTMRVGDSGAGTANGLPLPPGGSMVLTTSAAVYAYNPHATTAESLAVMEING